MFLRELATFLVFIAALSLAGQVDTDYVPLPVQNTSPPPPIWPYYGKYNGTFGSSCGYQLLPGQTDAPLWADCIQALQGGVSIIWWTDEKGVQTSAHGTCSLSWHPPVFAEDSPEAGIGNGSLAALWSRVMTGCETGSSGEYISNFAYTSYSDETSPEALDQTPAKYGFGLVSVWRTGDGGDCLPAVTGETCYS